MSNTVVEKIVLETTATKPNLTGLQQTYAALRNIDLMLGSIQGKFHAFTSDASFKRPKGFFEGAFKTKSVGRDQAAQMFGFDAADVKAYAANLKATLKDEHRKIFASGDVFRSAPQMEKFFQGYQKAVLRGHKAQANALQQLLNSQTPGGPTGPAVAGGAATAPAKVTANQLAAIVSGTEKIILNIPASMIEARLIGKVGLGVGGGDAENAGAVAAVAGGGAAGGLAGGVEVDPPPPSKAELRRRVTRTKKKVLTAITEATAAFETVTQITNAAGEVVSDITTSSPMGKLRNQLNTRLKSAAEGLKQGGADAFDANKAASHRAQAGVFKQTAANLSALADEFEGRFGDVKDMGPIASLRERAATMQAKARREEKRAILEDTRAQEKARKETERAAADAQRAADQARAGEVRDWKARGKDAQQRDKARAKQEASARRAQKLLDRELAGQFAVAEAERVRAGLAGQGFTQTGSIEGTRVVGGQVRRTVTQAFRKEAGGQMFGRALTVEFDAAGKAVEARLSSVQRAMKATRSEAGASGRDMLRNIAHVSTWAAGVGVLYGTLGLATRGLRTMIDVGYETARLEQVFRGVGGSASALRDDVIALAAANGRSAEEAIESAVAWSRLGLTKKQVAESVRVSLMAANVAEITAVEATEKLQGVMAAYRLQVSALGDVLGQANAISNTFNVTNNDMLTGLSRTASVAAQAGLGLSELMGLIGAAVGTTGQTGANIGNAIKSITVALGSPEKQNFLRKEFQLETRSGATGDLKNLSQTLGELWMAYERATGAERQFMLQQIAGKTQASRMAALLDSYVRAQVLAINAQLSLNSAEEENAKIKATLKAQLQGLVTEWDRFMAKRGDHGMTAALAEVTEGLHNLLKIANAPGVSHGLSMMAGMAALLGARMLVTGIRMKEAAGQGGFFVNTMRRARGTVTELGNAQRMAYRESVRVGQSWLAMDPISRRLLVQMRALGVVMQRSFGGGAMASAIGGTVKGLAAGLAVLRNWAGPLLLISGAMMGFNKIMEAAGRSSSSADKAVEKFGATARQAASAAQSAQQAAALYGRAGQMMTDSSVSEDRKRALVGDLQRMGRLAGGGVDSLGLSDDAAADLKVLMAQGKWAEVAAVMEGKRADAVRRARVERELEFRSTIEQEAKLDQEIERLQGSAWPSAGLIAEKQAQKEELQGKRVSMVIEDTEGNDYSAALQFDMEHQKALERQKALVQSIAEIYRTLPANSIASRVGADISGLEAQLAVVRREEERLTEAGRESAAKSAAREAARREIEGQIEAIESVLREQVQSADALGGDYQIAPGDVSRLTDLRARHGALGVEDDPDYNRRKGQMAALAEQRMEMEKQLAARKAEMEGAAELDRIRMAQEGARAQASEFDVGTNSTERLLNREEGLKRLIAAKARDAGSGTGSEEQRRRTVVELLQHEADLMDTLIQKAHEHHRINQEEAQLLREKTRERQKELLSAGPGEMLRKLAANQMAASGRMNMGSFFALDPQMREEMMKIPEFSFERRELQQRRNSLGKQMTPDALEAARRASEERMSGARGKFGGSNGLLLQTAAAAVELRGMANSATAATASLGELKRVAGGAAAAIAQAFALKPAGSSRGGNPQTMGHKAGQP